MIPQTRVHRRRERGDVAKAGTIGPNHVLRLQLLGKSGVRDGTKAAKRDSVLPNIDSQIHVFVQETEERRVPTRAIVQEPQYRHVLQKGRVHVCTRQGGVSSRLS